MVVGVKSDNPKSKQKARVIIVVQIRDEGSSTRVEVIRKEVVGFGIYFKESSSKIC